MSVSAAAAPSGVVTFLFRRAVHFFWSMLVAASVASVAGNIAHTVPAEPGHAPIAATDHHECCDQAAALDPSWS